MKLALISDTTPLAQQRYQALWNKHSFCDPEAADILVVLGGDGFMLQTMHRWMHTKKPMYGLNSGSVGFLLNEYAEIDLLERIAAADEILLSPLQMVATNEQGVSIAAKAINEISLFRQGRQAAHLKVLVDDVERLEDLICDGLLVATPAGSTAYNLSADGPILPIEANLLAMTPISPFRPRRWRGALLQQDISITLHVLDSAKRPVVAAADFTEVRNVQSVQIQRDQVTKIPILFDAQANLTHRVLQEQFWG